jgi:hypothetical protein
MRACKIKDVRFATEKDIDALRVAFFGIVTGIFWKKKHNILLIDFEDEYGIIQHLTFEGDNDIEYAENELYDIRKGGERNRELQPPLPEKSQLPENPEQKRYWKCPRCQGQNTLKAEFCTRCQFEKP